jgi:hypothetical protein
VGVPAPAVRVPASGRLEIAAEALREGEVLALALSMPDEARGSGPRAVRVVDVAGRGLDVEAQPIEGAGSGIRIEIDPDWLTPGTYMIQVESAESGPLALRRYVLTVIEPAG